MFVKDQEQGQIALVVLLIMTVTLVIALSLARGTTEEISRTTQKGETVKIFSAAESGAEYLLTSMLTAMKANDAEQLENLTTNPVDYLASDTIEAESDSQVSYQVDVSQSLEVNLAAGEASEVSFVDETGSVLSGNTNVTFSWGQPEADPCSQASMIFGRYYDLADGNGPRVTYTAVGPVSCDTRNSTDGFEAATAATNTDYANQYTITFDTDDLFVRLIPVYYPSQVFVSSASELPTQQRFIKTEAINQLSETQESQTVAVSTTNLQHPNYLDYAIYSGQNLTKTN